MATVFLTHDPESLRDFYGEAALAALRELAAVRINNTRELLSNEALLEQAAGCEFVVADVNTPFDAVFFDRTSAIALLRCAVDTRTIDIEAASRNGVLVTNASPGFVHAVSELIFGVMIDLARHVTRAASAYHTGSVPDKRMGRELKGSTIGIIGYGSVGTQVAEIAKAFGMNVLVCDPFKTVSTADIEQASLTPLLQRSDFVVCLAIANAETENLLDAAAVAHMRRDGYFINASRGDLVDEEALQQALSDGRIAGAALDVGRASGQMPNLEIARMDNVIATPHIGGLTPPATRAQALETVEQVRALLSGQVPHNALNAEHAHRLG